MPYDPNDPNQGSQAPPEDQSTPEWQAKNAMTTGTINDLIRSRPAIASWLALHNNGKGLSDADKSALASLMKQQGVDPTNLEVDDETGEISWPKHTARDIAYGSLLAFGPIVAGWALPYVTGVGGTAATPASEGTLASLGGGGAAAADVGAGATVAGGIEGGAFGLGDTALAGLGTGAMGATAVPAGVGASAVSAAADPAAWDAAGNFIGDTSVTSAATGGGIGATIGKIASSSWFPSVIGAAANLGGAAIQANASDKAAELQSQSAKDALDFAKSQAALEQKNFAPYLAAGTGALSKLSYGLGIGDAADYNSNGMPATPPGGSPGSLTPAGDPVVGPHSPAANFINSTRTQPVWMTAPNGERQQVPANQVQHYLDLKATIDPGQGLDGGSVPRPGSLAMIGRAPVPSATVGTATARV